MTNNSDARLAFQTLIESDASDFESYWDEFYQMPGIFVNAPPLHKDDPTRGQIGPLLAESTAPGRAGSPGFSSFLKRPTLERWIRTAVDSSASPRAAEAFADLSVAKRTRSFDYDFPLSSPDATHEFGQP